MRTAFIPVVRPVPVLAVQPGVEAAQKVRRQVERPKLTGLHDVLPLVLPDGMAFAVFHRLPGLPPLGAVGIVAVDDVAADGDRAGCGERVVDELGLAGAAPDLRPAPVGRPGVQHPPQADAEVAIGLADHLVRRVPGAAQGLACGRRESGARRGFAQRRQGVQLAAI